MGKRFFIFLFIYFLFSANTFAGIVISKVLPNTVDDKNLEYIELTNTGEEDIDISGYYIQDKTGKEYIFPEDEILTSGDHKKYLRSDIKIILNNSNEELYLYDSDGEEIDKASYSSSEKSVPIIIDIGEEGQDENDDEEIGETSTTKEITSDDNEDESDNISDRETVFKIDFDLQRPSYITLSGSGGYVCDRSREECKVNFDFRKTFSDVFSEKDYICDIDFGFESEQSHKCNPNTVIIPEGDNIVHIKVISKSDPTLFIEREIEIENDGYDANAISPSSANVMRKYISIPSIEVQSGIIEKDGKYICEKEVCRVNFMHKNRHKNLGCVWSFGKGSVYNPSTIRRCNPGYVTYPYGEFKVSLTLYQKNMRGNFRQGHFLFEHKEGNQKVVEEESEIELAQQEESVASEVFISQEFTDIIVTKSKSVYFEPIEVYDYSVLKIGEVLPNPIGNDIKEWISINNAGTSKMNLKGCILDDIQDGGSKPYTIEEDLFIEGNSTYKFHKVFTGINLNNSGDSVSLSCGDEIIDSVSWDYKVPDNLAISSDYPNGQIVYRINDISNLSSEDYDLYARKTFRQSERLLKKGFKISGETLPNTQVNISFGSILPNISLVSDRYGLYETVLKTGLTPGEVQVKTEVKDINENVFMFESKKTLEITPSYIASLKVAPKKKKVKKAAIKKPKQYFIAVANAGDDKEVELEENINNLALIFLILLSGFLFSFLAMKRRGFFD